MEHLTVFLVGFVLGQFVAVRVVVAVLERERRARAHWRSVAGRRFLRRPALPDERAPGEPLWWDDS